MCRLYYKKIRENGDWFSNFRLKKKIGKQKNHSLSDVDA